MNEKVETTIHDRQGLKEVWTSYIIWFIGATVLAVVATIAAYTVNLYQPFTALQIRIIQILSLLPEATALGQSGLTLQSFGGGISRAEKLNERLYAILTSIGFFLMVFSFQLE